MIEVLIADDHAVVRRGRLRQILAETVDIVVGAEELQPPYDVLPPRARRARWDAVILDVDLPGASGTLELLADIRRERPGLPVLILTVYSEDQYAVRAIRAGAAGFLTKEAAPDRLVDAVGRSPRAAAT